MFLLFDKYSDLEVDFQLKKTKNYCTLDNGCFPYKSFSSYS